MKTIARIFGIAFALLTAGCQYTTKEEEIGFKGPARRDAFLAAERFLKKFDYSVEVVRRFGDGPPDRATLITSPDSFVNYGMARRTIEWVERGGHLVLFMEGGRQYQDDWSKFNFNWREGDNAEVTQLFKELGIARGDKVDAGKVSFKIMERDFTVEIPSRFKLTKPLASWGGTVLGGTKDSAGIASFPRVRGRVTIIGDAKPFRNRYIGEGENARALWLIVGQTAGNPVWFLHASRVSFFEMLWKYGWMAIVALAALLAIWLWKSLPRFGPIGAIAQKEGREYTEQLRLTGAFLYRHRAMWPLIGAMREAVFRLTDRRGLIATMPDFFDQVGTLGGMPPARARMALIGEEVREPHYFLRVVQDLQTLREKL